MHLHAVLSCAALAATLSAQSTWIVDASGGPGSQFTTVQSAVDAASAGDVILVRPGTYEAFSASKGVAILGAPSFDIFLLSETIVLEHVPEDQHLILANATVFSLFGDAPSIVIGEAMGSVHLQNTSVELTAGIMQTTEVGALEIADCRDVTLTGCAIEGGTRAIHATRSDLTLVATSVHGTDSAWVPIGFHIELPVWPGPGLVADSSTVHVSRSDFVGGNGLTVSTAGEPAIYATASTLAVTGVTTDVVFAGASIWPMAAITADEGSLVELDPLLNVQGSAGGPPLAGAAAFVERRIVSLDVRGGTLGGSLVAEAASSPDDFVVILLGVPGPALPSPFGTVRIGLSTAVVVAQQVQPDAGVTQAVLGIPNAVVLRGLLLALQAANLDHRSGRIELSNVAVIALQ